MAHIGQLRNITQKEHEITFRITFQIACEDLGDCTNFASKCDEKDVRDICPKTCGSCKKVDSVGSCKNTNPLCGAMASSCSVDTVQEICVKNTWLCAEVAGAPVLDPVICKDDNSLCTKLAGSCNEEEVREQCRMTCKSCGRAVPCEDKNELCHNWADTAMSSWYCRTVQGPPTPAFEPCG